MEQGPNLRAAPHRCQAPRRHESASPDPPHPLHDSYSRAGRPRRGARTIFGVGECIIIPRREWPVQRRYVRPARLTSIPQKTFTSAPHHRPASPRASRRSRRPASRPAGRPRPLVSRPVIPSTPTSVTPGFLPIPTRRLCSAASGVPRWISPCRAARRDASPTSARGRQPSSGRGRPARRPGRSPRPRSRPVQA